MDFGDIVRAALEETIPGLLPALIAEEIREANADGRDGATDARRAGNVADVPAPRDARFETAEEWKRNVKKKKTRRGRGHAERRQRELYEARRAKERERRRQAARREAEAGKGGSPMDIPSGTVFDFGMEPVRPKGPGAVIVEPERAWRPPWANVESTEQDRDVATLEARMAEKRLRDRQAYYDKKQREEDEAALQRRQRRIKVAWLKVARQSQVHTAAQPSSLEVDAATAQEIRELKMMLNSAVRIAEEQQQSFESIRSHWEALQTSTEAAAVELKRLTRAVRYQSEALGEDGRYLAALRSEIKEAESLLLEARLHDEYVYHQQLLHEISEQEVAAKKKREVACAELRKVKKEVSKLQDLSRHVEFEKQKQQIISYRMQEGLILGGDGVKSMMAAAVGGHEQLEMRPQLGEQWLCTYRNAGKEVFEVQGVSDIGEVQVKVNEAKLRRECRGLVLGEVGVVARPLQKFFSEGQVGDAQMRWIRTQAVVEATEKLDGIMVYGVLSNGVMQFWTRSGYTDAAVNVNRWAVGQGSLGANFFGLLEAVEERGSTATFEWIGRQSTIKVKEKEIKLVLLQIRDKVSGRYWNRQEVLETAEHYRVPCVRRFPSYEGKSYHEVHCAVKASKEHTEGVVLRLGSGQMIKVKTTWWLGKVQHKYKRWLGPEQRNQEEYRREKKMRMMDVQELRAVVKGLPMDVSPATLLRSTGAKKVEAFYARNGGQRGAVILSFHDIVTKHSAMRSQNKNYVELLNAYGCRANSNSWHRVRTWYV